jgi:hypothetical protein
MKKKTILALILMSALSVFLAYRNYQFRTAYDQLAKEMEDYDRNVGFILTDCTQKGNKIEILEMKLDSLRKQLNQP